MPELMYGLAGRFIESQHPIVTKSISKLDVLKFGCEASRRSYASNLESFSVVKVTIITVVYNGAQTIATALQSVATQTYPNIEHIVIDGGSSDGTVEILDKYRAGLAKVISEPDNGIYDAMNKGLRCATGEIIGLLNADDLYADPEVLRKVVDVLSDSSLDACYGDLVYVDPKDTSRVVRYWKSQEYRAGLFSRGWVPPHPTFFVRRNVYQRFGYFDLRYHLAADFELMMRFLEKKKVKSKYIPNVLVKMRLGGATNNSLSNIWKQNVEIYQSARQHNIAMSPMLFVFNKLIARAKQFLTRPGDAR